MRSSSPTRLQPQDLTATSSGLPTFVPTGCRDCRNRSPLDVPITMAFQPIVDVSRRALFGYEALVRGSSGQGAADILAKVDESNRYSFDQTCRVTAIDLASRLQLQGMLSINFLPGAVYRPETCIRATLEAAAEMNFPLDRLMFEVTESEEVLDHAHLKNIFVEYKRQGFTTAIDDFGAGHSGLNLLADFQPDIVKLDMALTRGVDADRVRRAIVSSIVRLCDELSIQVIAEGVETPAECLALQDEGIVLFQGYLFARPGFEHLPAVADTVWRQVAQRRNADKRRMRR
jgi:EAL domain-containing protein (putative c-di-GMP-specific phosphodiesterase class I)